VPVAVSLGTIREAKDAAGDFFRSAQQQKHQYQGIWVVAPDGKVLAAHHEFKSTKTWARELLATLGEARAATGDLAPRKAPPTEPLPYRGVGVRPDGTVSLAAYTRLLHNGRPAFTPLLDTLTLSSTEWAALAPPEPAAGKRWTVTEKVARRFSRCLSADNGKDTLSRPEHVTAVTLAGVVERVDRDGIAWLSYTGRIAGVDGPEGKARRGNAEITGAGTFDTKRKQQFWLALVFEGVYRHHPPYDEPRQLVTAVEWRLER